MNDLDVGTNFRDADTDKELAHFMGNFECPRVGEMVRLLTAVEGGGAVAVIRTVVSVDWSFMYASRDGQTPIVGRIVRLR